MGKVKLVFVFVFLMIIFPFVSKADCSYERQALLSKIASNVQINYTYNMDPDVMFNVLITNVTNDIYILDGDGHAIKGPESSLTYLPGEKLEYTIYSNDESCRGEVIQKRYVNLPTYNVYSSLKECKENPDFSLCGVWADLSGYSYYDFTNELEKYKKNSKSVVKNDDDKTSFFDFLIENKKILLMVFIFIVILVLLILFKNKKEVRG